MAAESTSKSLISPEQNMLQLSEQGVVAPFLTIIESQSLEKTKKDLVILLFLLQALTENVMSGDVMHLAAFSTIDRCEKIGMDTNEVTERMQAFLKVAKENRSRNPISEMF